MLNKKLSEWGVIEEAEDREFLKSPMVFIVGDAIPVRKSSELGGV
jgi:hypothetical protein